jgi:hypothetical protein
MATSPRQRAYVNVPRKYSGPQCKKPEGTIATRDNCDPEDCVYSSPSKDGNRPAVCRLPRGTLSTRVPVSPRTTQQELRTKVNAILSGSGYTADEAKQVNQFIKLIGETRVPGQKTAGGSPKQQRRSTSLASFERRAAAGGNASPFQAFGARAPSPAQPGSPTSVATAKRSLTASVRAGATNPAAATILSRGLSQGTVVPEEVKGVLGEGKRSGDTQAAAATMDQAALTIVGNELNQISQQGPGGNAFAKAAEDFVRTSPDPVTAAATVAAVVDQVSASGSAAATAEATDALITASRQQAATTGGELTTYVPRAMPPPSTTVATRTSSGRAQPAPTGPAAGTRGKRPRAEEETEEKGEGARQANRPRASSARSASASASSAAPSSYDDYSDYDDSANYYDGGY